MLSETNIIKSILDKDFLKSKYMMSAFLRHVHNLLITDGDLEKTFTITSDAIFYLIGKHIITDNKRFSYTTWTDYSQYLEKSLNDNAFPKLLKSTINKITDYHYSSPILAKHSNERTLLKIVIKLLDKCIFGDNHNRNDKNDDGKYNGDTDSDKMEVENISEDVNLRNICKSFDVDECSLSTLDETVKTAFSNMGARSFADVTNFINTLFTTFNEQSIDQCLTKIIKHVSDDEDKRVGYAVKMLLSESSFTIHNFNYDNIRDTVFEFAQEYVRVLLSRPEEELNTGEKFFVREVRKKITTDVGSCSAFVMLCTGGLEVDIKQAHNSVQTLYTTTGMNNLNSIETAIRSIVVGGITLSEATISITRIIKYCAVGSVKECYQTINRVLSICGVQALGELYSVVERIKTAYTLRISEDNPFSFTEMPGLIESLIDENNTETYDYIPGGGNSEKLKHVHEHLTKHLKVIAPTLSYEEVVNFLKSLGQSKNLDNNVCNTILNDRTRLSTLISENNNYKEQVNSLQHQLTDCEYNLELEEKNRISLDKHNEMMKSLNAALHNSDEENAVLKTDIENISIKLEGAKEDEKKLNAKILSLEKTLYELEQENTILKSNNKNLSKKLEEAKDEVVVLQRKISEIDKSVDGSKVAAVPPMRREKESKNNNGDAESTQQTMENIQGAAADRGTLKRPLPESDSDSENEGSTHTNKKRSG